jgi:hypothetical protein
MLVKFFDNRGKGSSDPAVNYLLSEAPQKYLTGARDGQGVVRNPAPAVVKGDPELVRQLINQLQTEHRYTSGVISFERLISEEAERQIIANFEKISFPGLGPERYACLWVAHRHLKRSELHFLVPRCELITGKALNIHPPRARVEGLYDVFRKLTNHEFNLKDPSGTRLTLDDRERLSKKLTSLVAAREAYNRSRYRVTEKERNRHLLPKRHEDRDRSAHASPTTSRPRLPGARQIPRGALERIGRGTRTLGQERERLEHTSQCLGRAAQPLPERLAQVAGHLRHRAASQAIFLRYSIPELHHAATPTRGIENDDMEMDRADQI